MGEWITATPILGLPFLRDPSDFTTTTQATHEDMFIYIDSKMSINKCHYMDMEGIKRHNKICKVEQATKPLVCALPKQCRSK